MPLNVPALPDLTLGQGAHPLVNAPTLANSTVVLSWTRNAGVKQEVLLLDSSEAVLDKIVVTGLTSVSFVPGGNQTKVSVRNTFNDGSKADSPAQALPVVATIAPPAGVTLAQEAGSLSFLLSYNARPSNATGTEVEVLEGGVFRGGVTLSSPTGGSVNTSSLQYGRAYTVRLRHVSSTLQSAWVTSNSVTLTEPSTGGQIVTVGASIPESDARLYQTKAGGGWKNFGVFNKHPNGLSNSFGVPIKKAKWYDQYLNVRGTGSRGPTSGELSNLTTNLLNAHDGDTSVIYRMIFTNGGGNGGYEANRNNEPGMTEMEAYIEGICDHLKSDNRFLTTLAAVHITVIGAWAEEHAWVSSGPFDSIGLETLSNREALYRLWEQHAPEDVPLANRYPKYVSTHTAAGNTGHNNLKPGATTEANAFTGFWPRVGNFHDAATLNDQGSQSGWLVWNTNRPAQERGHYRTNNEWCWFELEPNVPLDTQGNIDDALAFMTEYCVASLNLDPDSGFGKGLKFFTEAGAKGQLALDQLWLRLAPIDMRFKTVGGNLETTVRWKLKSYAGLHHPYNLKLVFFQGGNAVASHVVSPDLRLSTPRRLNTIKTSTYTSNMPSLSAGTYRVYISSEDKWSPTNTAYRLLYGGMSEAGSTRRYDTGIDITVNAEGEIIGGTNPTTDDGGGVVDDALAFATQGLPPATTSQAYSTAVSATGGTGNYTYTKVSGDSEISVSSGGQISGTFTNPGTKALRVRVRDGVDTAIADFTISVTGAAGGRVTGATLTQVGDELRAYLPDGGISFQLRIGGIYSSTRISSSAETSTYDINAIPTSSGAYAIPNGATAELLAWRAADEAGTVQEVTPSVTVNNPTNSGGGTGSATTGRKTRPSTFDAVATPSNAQSILNAAGNGDNIRLAAGSYVGMTLTINVPGVTLWNSTDGISDLNNSRIVLAATDAGVDGGAGQIRVRSVTGTRWPVEAVGITRPYVAGLDVYNNQWNGVVFSRCTDGEMYDFCSRRNNDSGVTVGGYGNGDESDGAKFLYCDGGTARGLVLFSNTDDNFDCFGSNDILIEDSRLAYHLSSASGNREGLKFYRDSTARRCVIVSATPGLVNIDFDGWSSGNPDTPTAPVNNEMDRCNVIVSGGTNIYAATGSGHIIRDSVASGGSHSLGAVVTNTNNRLSVPSSEFISLAVPPNQFLTVEQFDSLGIGILQNTSSHKGVRGV